MHEEFQSAVRRLFEELRLGTPKFTEPNRVRLHVGDVALELVDSGLGTMLIDGVIGRLSSHAQERARQTRRILETNIGLLVDTEAGVFLRAATASVEMSVVARASQALRGLRMDRLTKKMEDVIGTVEYYSSELKGSTRADRTPRKSVVETVEPTMIFRP